MRSGVKGSNEVWAEKKEKRGGCARIEVHRIEKVVEGNGRKRGT